LYKVFLPFLIFGCYLPIYADSAVQTDWSGGDGILGPVLDWGNEFFQSSSIDWSSNPGSLLSQGILEHSVDSNYGGASCVYSEDIDGDGDMDVLGAARSDGDITWWENVDGLGTSWIEHTVDGSFNIAISVYAEDIDGDDDIDILGAAWSPSFDITWWENVDGLGTSWTEHTVDTYFFCAWSVCSEDIDGDGDMDILGAAASFTGKITWWENIDGSGTSWIEHTIEEDFAHSTCVSSADIDDDGDIDVLGAALEADEITWWENTDGSGTSWAKYTVAGDFYGAASVYSEDIDGDGDMDVLGAAYYGNEVTWWENIDGQGTSWTEHSVDEDFYGANSVYIEDLDGDGDMDLLGGAYFANDITWWENIDGQGTSWAKYTVAGDFYGAASVYSEDLDGDGNMDIIGAALEDNDISWWDLTPAGWLESSILDIQENPDWDYLEWNSQTPSGASVSFQVRASDDHTTMGAWSDTLSIPCLLEGILADGDQYVQYRVILETSYPVSTPTLFDVMLTWDPMGIEGGEYPAVQTLLPFSPNPSSSPAVRFGLPEPASVEISIFNLSGRLVDEIHGDEYSSGFHDVLLGDLSPGIYFCRMISGDFEATQRFVVIE
jgi:hypothetical protein